MGFMVAIILLIVTIVPNFIMPLFNKFDPLPQGRLRNRIEEIAKGIEFPLTEIYMIDASKRSSHSNAYYYGFGSNKRIVLFDTLLEQHKGDDGEREICGIVKHELGHWYHSHPLKMITISILNIALMFKIFDLMLNNRTVNWVILFDFGFKTESVFVSLLIFSKLYEVASWFTSLFINIISRTFEFQADQFATDEYRTELARGLIKIHVKNAANLNPDPLYAAMTFSHPQLTERLRALGFHDGREFEHLLK
jgi:STE24 endopeptidase